jgi:serine/threonine protein phosphatase PrpC
MEITYAAKSDVGLKRAHNEDSFCADASLGLYVICDGMGGRNAGEVASRLAVAVIRKHVMEAFQDPALPVIGRYDDAYSPIANRLASAIRLANQAINSEARRQLRYAGMGTTVVSACITGQVLSLAHVGDSRMYLVRGGRILPMTADHSLVAEEVRQGLLTEEEAERASHKHTLTRAVGVEPTVDVELAETRVMSGDTVLLCSDGLTCDVKLDDILAIVRAQEAPHAIAEQLIKLAKAAGGHDNTTVIVLAIRQPRRSLWRRMWRHLVG